MLEPNNKWKLSDISAYTLYLLTTDSPLKGIWKNIWKLITNNERNCGGFTNDPYYPFCLGEINIFSSPVTKPINRREALCFLSSGETVRGESLPVGECR